MKVGRFFWTVWGLDALIAAGFLFFFFWGLSDGTVSAFNILLWLGILACLAIVVGGGFYLQSQGRTRPAMGLLLILAIPGALALLFFLALVILHPRWN